MVPLLSIPSPSLAKPPHYISSATAALGLASFTVRPSFFRSRSNRPRTLFRDDGYREELKEIRPGELGHLNVPKVNKTYSYCNWIQCKEENKGTVCGKWRRAPFFETQTDNWDCSCSVLWDPSYADCAVPQLRHRLAQKETSQQAIQ